MLINNKKIIVTGAGGLIGSYAIERLHQSGYEVLGLYHQQTSKNTAWPIGIIDLAKEDLKRVTGSHSIDAIVHCAAVIPKSFSECGDVYLINKNIDDNVLNYIRQSEARLIYVSSTSLYGKKEGVIKERDAVDLTNAYSIGKYETEQTILKENLQSVILRINAPYAPQQRMNTVLKIFIERALQNLPLQFHGTGQRKQDFTAAEDIAIAIEKCVEKKNIVDVFNISGGHSVSMKELAKIIVGLTPNCSSQINPSGLPDEQENYQPVFSIEKAKTILSWQPQVQLEAGIKKWINYLSDENRDHF